MIPELPKIKSTQIIYIISSIKNIQHRMLEPELINADYATVYSVLQSEFNDFYEKYDKIFKLVVDGENLYTVASILYFKNKCDQGLASEQEVADMVNSKFIPENLLNESKAAMETARNENSEQDVSNEKNIPR